MRLRKGKGAKEGFTSTLKRLHHHHQKKKKEKRKSISIAVALLLFLYLFFLKLERQVFLPLQLVTGGA